MRYFIRSKDEEKRQLRTHVSQLEQANKRQKEARKKIEQENRELKRQNKELRKQQKQLEREKEDLRKQRDRYRNMLFKSNVRAKKKSESEILEDDLRQKVKKNKRGGQKGHKGHGRKKPKEADVIKRVYVKNCPICGKRVKRSKKVNTHTVEDIPLEKFKTEVTCYEIEEQWCGCCKKRVRAHPVGVIPKSRLGINILIYGLIQKYGARNSWPSILFTLKTYFNIEVSEGALINMMHRARKWLGPWYERILEEIRGSPVKYADETTWRIDGINHWLWGFFTEENAYYTVEKSRGKGVATEHLSESHHHDVLVRDDYPGYKNLPLQHQSCWAHLLRKSREAAADPHASKEVKELHEQLKKMYKKLRKIIELPFDVQKRNKKYEKYTDKIDEIIAAKYHQNDSKEIHTRISNQRTNLITALKYPNVPLTNNLSERCIRPFVVARKMSGGSRSEAGAKTQAVNMSILQTIKMQNLPLLSTLKENLSTGWN